MEVECIREDIAFIKQQIDMLLKKQSYESYVSIEKILDVDYVKSLMEFDTELTIVKLLLSISKTEYEKRVTPMFLFLESDFSKLIDLYYKVLFGLQRIWFELEEHYLEEWMDFIKNKAISPYAVYMILNDSRIGEKEEVWNRVCELWEKNDE